MDLRDGRAFWPTDNGLIQTYPPLRADTAVDVAVIGAGITGALLADALTHAGLSVAVLDRRDVASGSTSASTALLQFEIDTNLHELRDMIGQGPADRAYHLCRDAIDLVGELCRQLPDGCGFGRNGSLYYASLRRDGRMLEREQQAREEAGLNSEYLSSRELYTRFGIKAPAALFTPDGAEVDPYRLAHGLLARVAQRGGLITDRTTVTQLEEGRSGWTLHTDRGPKVQAGWVIVATGYEAEQFLGHRLARLKNSYALATEPLPEDTELWPTGCLIWETARPYLYARTTPDRRIIIGGEDDPFHSPERRERRLKSRAQRLHKALGQLQPQLDTEIAFSWAGTFGETKDGLAYIGPQPGKKRLLFALGYGGNGITYSVQAARLLTAHILGADAQDRADLNIFRLDR